MKSVGQIQRQGKVKDVRASAAAAGLPTEEIDSTGALIQALIPLGLQAVGGALDAEVTTVAGTRYCRTGGRPGVVRWGQQPGSVYRAAQTRPVPVPRVRDRVANREIPLTTYERRRVPRAAEAGLFRKVRVGLTCRQYEACAEAVPAAVGLRASRRFIRASARHLRTGAWTRTSAWPWSSTARRLRRMPGSSPWASRARGRSRSGASSRRPPSTSRSVRRSCGR